MAVPFKHPTLTPYIHSLDNCPLSTATESNSEPAPILDPVSKNNQSVFAEPALAEAQTQLSDNTDTVREEVPDAPEYVLPLWQVEMKAIDNALRVCGGNITQAAKLLEINPSTIHRKRQSWIKNGLVEQKHIPH